MQHRKLHIVMPMAGNGQRFKDAGYGIPKPLIPVYNNISIYEKALSSFDILNHLIGSDNIKYTFIVRKEFIDDAKIDEKLHKNYPLANILNIDHTTNGALETSYMAAGYIDDDDAVVLMDCDMYFNSYDYSLLVYKEMQSDMPHPCLLTFVSDNPRYSYVRVDSSGHAADIAEKQVISHNAILGCYFVGTGQMFKDTAKKVIDNWYNNIIRTKEIYTSLLYNEFISFAPVEVFDHISPESFVSMGTPEELENYKSKLQ